MLATAAFHEPESESPGLAAALVQSAVKLLGSDMYSRREEAVAAKHLICITQLLPLPMLEWRSGLVSALSGFESVDIHELLRGARGAGSWLMLRFGK